jgi:alpha-tubulin suppressor-like RCC1 family protein
VGSALYGRTVVVIAGGYHFSLALCRDGTVAAWGRNVEGQLGNNTGGYPGAQRLVPVAVNADPSLSALYGKLVTAIAAGFGHSLALCSDGTVAAWGLNSYGELGDNSTIGHLVPVAVNTERLISVLHGKVVAAIAAGSFRSLAVCSDGTVAAWGANDSGQLGNDTVETSQAPVAVSTASGVSALSGNTAVATASGYTPTAWCSARTALWPPGAPTATASSATTPQRNATRQWQ